MPALGRKIELANRFSKSLERIGYRLVASDLRNSSETLNGVDFFEAPGTNHETFLDWARVLCVEQNIRWIVPSRDAEMFLWSKWKAARAIDAEVLVSELDLMSRWHGKVECARWLNEVGLPHPGWFVADSDLSECSGKMILKPVMGSASQGVRLFDLEIEELEKVPEGTGAQRFIEGLEYTVNLYFDSIGTCKAIIPHRRLRVRNGEVSHGMTVDEGDLIDLANRFAAATSGRARGPINFQVIRENDTNELFITDINPRFGGGYPLTHSAGGRFTDWICQEFFHGVAVNDFSWKPGFEWTRA